MQHIQTLYGLSGTSFVPAFSASSLDALKIKIFSREVIYLKETINFLPLMYSLIWLSIYTFHKYVRMNWEGNIHILYPIMCKIDNYQDAVV